VKMYAALPIDEDFYTIEEVARRLRVSARWLADECRAERVEHVHIARQRRFTKQQVDALIAGRTVVPSADKKLDLGGPVGVEQGVKASRH
jgi:excisionase family DNA binding protein